MPRGEAPRVERYSERVQTIVEFAHGTRVLHLGACGTLKANEQTRRHFTHAALVDAGFSVLATDVNEAGLQWMGEQGYDVAYLDAEAIPADGEKFDTIAAGELLEHLSNPGLMLEGCAPRLKPEGVLVLSVPQPFSPLHVLVYLFKYPGAFNLEHSCWYDAQTLSQLLGRYGYEIVEMRFVDDLYVEGAGRAFRFLASAWLRVRRFFPERLRTGMVVKARFGGREGVGRQPYADEWESERAEHR
jgi:SAM-dependent methyltransferase